MTSVTEQTDRNRPTGGVAAAAPAACTAADAAPDAPSPAAALRTLAVVLERASADLLAMVPFAGEHHTGHEIHRYVDEVSGTLRSLSADADDLHRAVLLAQHRTGQEH